MKKQCWKIHFGPIAKLEIEDATIWYENQQVGLGEVFITAVENAILKISESPDAYSKVQNHRQFPLKNFPFIILYEVSAGAIFIDAVFHTSRNPKKKIRKKNI